MDLKNTIQNSL